MSSSIPVPPGLEKNSDYWVDVEVPYNKIHKKWDRKYKTNMNRHIKNGRLQHKILDIYFKALGRDDSPNDRNDAIELLYDLNQSWAINLYCQFEYSDNTSPGVIEKHAKDIKDRVYGTEFEEYYDKNIGAGDSAKNKDGLVAIIQLFDPDRLKDILIQDRATGRVPTNSYKRNSQSPPDESEWKKVVELLSENENSRYAVWNQFTFDNKKYVAVEEEDRDGVERQVGSNIEKEPANLIIIEFHSGYMDIYSKKKSTADLVQVGVNNDVTGSDFDKDRNKVDPKDVSDFADGVVSRDSGKKKSNYEYTLTRIKTAVPSLDNSPEIQLSSNDGVGKAVEQLEKSRYFPIGVRAGTKSSV